MLIRICAIVALYAVAPAWAGEAPDVAWATAVQHANELTLQGRYAEAAGDLEA